MPVVAHRHPGSLCCLCIDCLEAPRSQLLSRSITGPDQRPGATPAVNKIAAAPTRCTFVHNSKGAAVPAAPAHLTREGEMMGSCREPSGCRTALMLMAQLSVPARRLKAPAASTLGNMNTAPAHSVVRPQERGQRSTSFRSWPLTRRSQAVIMLQRLLSKVVPHHGVRDARWTCPSPLPTPFHIPMQACAGGRCSSRCSYPAQNAQPSLTLDLRLDQPKMTSLAPAGRYTEVALAAAAWSSRLCGCTQRLGSAMCTHRRGSRPSRCSTLSPSSTSVVLLASMVITCAAGAPRRQGPGLCSEPAVLVSMAHCSSRAWCACAADGVCPTVVQGCWCLYSAAQRMHCQGRVHALRKSCRVAQPCLDGALHASTGAVHGGRAGPSQHLVMPQVQPGVLIRVWRGRGSQRLCSLLQGTLHEEELLKCKGPSSMPSCTDHHRRYC